MAGNIEQFVQNSRLSAKIDAGLVYDKIGIYQHSFIFTKNSKWVVIQQAIDVERKEAIRFQWFSELVNYKDIANEPHAAISSEMRQTSLDLTNSDKKWAR